jgi:hypothetical protein
MWNRSAATFDHGFSGRSVSIIGSLLCTFWYSWHIEHLLIKSSICEAIPIQNRTSLALLLHLLIPICDSIHVSFSTFLVACFSELSACLTWTIIHLHTKCHLEITSTESFFSKADIYLTAILLLWCLSLLEVLRLLTSLSEIWNTFVHRSVNTLVD